MRQIRTVTPWWAVLIAGFITIAPILAEDPAPTPAPEPATPTSWRDGIVEDFPVDYASLIPGYQAGESTSLEISGGNEEVATPEPSVQEPSQVSTDSSANGESTFSEWLKNKNVVNGLILVGILLLFIFYQVRTRGSRRKG